MAAFLTPFDYTRPAAAPASSRLVRDWCTVGYAIAPYANGGRSWTWSHQWHDGRCRHCRKTVRQVLVPEAAKRREP